MYLLDKPILFKQEQLVWFEELDPNYFVRIKVQEKGDGKFNKEENLAQVVQLKELFGSKYANSENNLWRSWAVFRDADLLNGIGFVPLILDIDDADHNLENAYTLTRFCLDILEERRDWAGPLERLRVVFSGKKGFHLEVKPPKPLDAGDMRNDLIKICGTKFEHQYNVFFENTSIDPFHDWVRLTGTRYSWYSSNGELNIRRIFQMSPEEFRSTSVSEILQRADDV